MASNDWARARAIMAAPAAMTFKELKDVCAALGGRIKNRAEAEGFLGAVDYSTVSKTQKEQVQVALGLTSPAPAMIVEEVTPPAEVFVDEDVEVLEEEETPPPARRGLSTLGWLAIAFGALLLFLVAAVLVASIVLRNALNNRSDAGAVVPTPMVVAATPIPTQKVSEPPAVVPTLVVTEAPVVVEPLIVEADSVFHFNGLAPAYSDFRAAVRQPGDAAVFVWNFDTGLENAVLRRIWPDDILVSATLLIPGQQPQDLTELFGMFFVPANGTGDSALDVVLKERGVNIVEGEILQQNKFAILLGNVPAGSKIVFEIKDNEELAVNRGIGVVIDQTVDAFTIPVK